MHLSTNISEYYRVLGLTSNCTVDDIKKSYRKIAREYHPDLNHDPGATDIFISATEAYEFLMANHSRLTLAGSEYEKLMEEWRKFRSQQARQRASAYARTSYSKFRNTSFYKSTRIFDGTTIIASLIVSLMVLVIAVVGYIYRLHHPIPGLKNPSVFILVIFILLGMTFFIKSYIHLKAYLESSKRKSTDDQKNN